MTACLTPREFEEQWAALNIEDEFLTRLAAMVAAEVHNGFERMMFANGLIKEEHVDLKAIEDFVYPKEQQPKGVLSASASEAQAKARYG